MIGRPPISSRSFANAIIEPANETLPISPDRTTETDSLALMSPGAGIELWKSASAISAAAPPPTPLNSATISGIAVIFTARAAYAPTGAATAITIRIDA